LPLTHLLILPFAWSATLLHTGVTLPAALCYLLSTLCVFIAARCLTQDSRASFIGSLLFIFNPTLLMLHTLSFNDWISITTLTMTCCCFLLWTRHNRLSSLIGTALGSVLATLTCYDGWALFVSLIAFMIAIGWLKRQSRAHIESSLIAFGSLGALGIAVWMLCCATLFGDPFVFLRQASPASLSLHNVGQAIAFTFQASIQTLTPVLFSVAFLGMVLFIARRRLAPETIAGIAFLVPFAFSLLSLSGGYVVIPFVSSMNILQALQQHAGIATIAPAALFLAALVGPETRKIFVFGKSKA
jgi:4-amino-4-deoxy-L-arabinose transferase-like glycosyltransferase